MATVIGQRWETLNYALDGVKQTVPRKGEMACVDNTPGYDGQVLELKANGALTIQELYENKAALFDKSEIYENIDRSIDGKLAEVLAEVDANFIPASEKGAANGVAALDGGGKVPAGQLPSGLSDAALAQSLSAQMQAIQAALAALKAETAKIILPKSGYFALYANASGELKAAWLRLKANGDLAATVMDGEPNPFRHDPETGNLYYMSQGET
jgi:hypothetical protein